MTDRPSSPVGVAAHLEGGGGAGRRGLGGETLCPVGIVPSGALTGLYAGANAGLGAALGSAKGMRAAEGKSMLNGVAAARGSTLAEGIVGSDPRLSPANPRVLLLRPTQASLALLPGRSSYPQLPKVRRVRGGTLHWQLRVSPVACAACLVFLLRLACL